MFHLNNSGVGFLNNLNGILASLRLHCFLEHFQPYSSVQRSSSFRHLPTLANVETSLAAASGLAWGNFCFPPTRPAGQVLSISQPASIGKQFRTTSMTSATHLCRANESRMTCSWDGRERRRRRRDFWHRLSLLPCWQIGTYVCRMDEKFPFPWPYYCTLVQRSMYRSRQKGLGENGTDVG